MTPRSDFRLRDAARAKAAAVFCSALVGAGMVLSGCGKPAPASASGPSAPQRHVYTVRAIIVRLPPPGERNPEIVARHEAMPHFVGQDGRLGMDTMTMPFPVAPSCSLDGLAPGDKVELTFEVDFDEREKQLLGYRATRAGKLPPDAALDFTPLSKSAP